MDWESALNCAHYYLVERRLAKAWRHLTRRWRALTAGMRRRMEVYRFCPQEVPRMEEVSTAPVPAAAVGRAILARFDSETVQALSAAISEEIRKEITEEAVAEARGQLEREFSDRQEHLLDQLARDRQRVEAEAAAAIEAAVATQLAAEMQEIDDRLDTLRARVRDWRDRAELAEGILTDLVQQLVGTIDQPATYLFSGGHGITSLNKAALNTVLAYAGLRLRSKASASERIVTVTLENGQQVGHTKFWMTKTPVEGVTYADDGDESGAHPDDPNTAEPLALPERTSE